MHTGPVTGRGCPTRNFQLPGTIRGHQQAGLTTRAPSHQGTRAASQAHQHPPRATKPPGLLCCIRQAVRVFLFGAGTGTAQGQAQYRGRHGGLPLLYSRWLTTDDRRPLIVGGTATRCGVWPLCLRVRRCGGNRQASAGHMHTWCAQLPAPNVDMGVWPFYNRPRGGRNLCGPHMICTCMLCMRCTCCVHAVGMWYAVCGV